MSEIEFAIWAIVLFVITIAVLNATTGWHPHQSDQQQWYWDNWAEFAKKAKDNAKLYKKLEKANLTLEELEIKKEEMENEVEKLTFDASTSFEKEKGNSTKIKKLNLELKHLDIKISEMLDNIDKINYEIQWMIY